MLPRWLCGQNIELRRSFEKMCGDMVFHNLWHRVMQYILTNHKYESDSKTFYPIPSKSPIHAPPPRLSITPHPAQASFKSHDTTPLHHLCHRQRRAHAQIAFHSLPNQSEVITDTPMGSADKLDAQVRRNSREEFSFSSSAPPYLALPQPLPSYGKPRIQPGIENRSGV